QRTCEHDEFGEGWCGDATSVVEFLRPLRDQLDAPGVLEVCVNRPGELLVETVSGWQAMPAPEMTQERCLSLATAVATFCDQQIKRLDDFEREGLFERTAIVTRTPNADLLPFEHELVALKDAGRYAEFLR